MQVENASPVNLYQSEPTTPIQPMSGKLSLLFFGIPALTLVAAYYGFRPWLKGMGYSDMVSYMASLCVPLILMFFAALTAYRFEGWPLTRAAFAARMRYPRLRLADVLWGIVIAVAGLIIGSGLLSQVSLWPIRAGFLSLPAGLPFFDDPLVTKSMDVLNQSAGGQIRGQWSLLIWFLVLYFFNIAGEELWWRGYILPRQELAFGRFTWLVHGLSWAVFHIFKWWAIPSLLPICLLIAYVSQKRQNNWAGLIAHAIVNGLALPFILAAVAGWI